MRWARVQVFYSFSELPKAATIIIPTSQLGLSQRLGTCLFLVVPLSL